MISRRQFGIGMVAVMAGDGLVRPLNAPAAQQIQPGVQPGAPGVITASRVIVTGAFGQVVITGGEIQMFPAVSTGAPGTLIEQSRGWVQLSSGITATAGDVAATLNLQAKDSASVGSAPLAWLADGTLLAPSQPGSSPSVPEDWHAVTTPAGMTGTIRVKVLAERNLAVLDINTVITSTNVAPTTYTAGSLPSAAYYPLAARQFPVSVNQQWSTTANASPRVAVPTSGAVTLPLPGFNSAGAACIVSGTVVYPLD